MEGKKEDRSLEKRIRAGGVTRKDVTRILAELACANATDCVRLVLEPKPELEGLDLRLLSEIRRGEKGEVMVKLVDRLQILRQLEQITQAAPEAGLETFLQGLQKEV